MEYEPCLNSAKYSQDPDTQFYDLENDKTQTINCNETDPRYYKLDHFATNEFEMQ